MGRESAVPGAVSLGWLEKDSLPQILKGLENNKVQKENTTKEEKLVNIAVLLPQGSFFSHNFASNP